MPTRRGMHPLCPAPIALLLLLSSASADALGPSLAETLAWMDSTYNSHEVVGGAFGHGRWEIFSDDGRIFERRTSSFSYDGCDISLRNIDDPTAPLFIDTMHSSILYHFNLNNIDPATITVVPYSSIVGLPCELAVCNRAKLEFETRNDAPVIGERSDTVYSKLKGANRESMRDAKTFVAEFYIDDILYARRFADAFRQRSSYAGACVHHFDADIWGRDRSYDHSRCTFLLPKGHSPS